MFSKSWAKWRRVRMLWSWFGPTAATRSACCMLRKAPNSGGGELACVRTRFWQQERVRRKPPHFSLDSRLSSRDASSLGANATTRCRCCLHAVSSIAFGAVKGFVGGIHDLGGVGFFLRRGGDPNADGDWERAGAFHLRQTTHGVSGSRATPRAYRAPVGPTWCLPAIDASGTEAGSLDPSAQSFEMFHNLIGRFACEQNREFFSATAVGLPASGYARQLRSH